MLPERAERALLTIRNFANAAWDNVAAIPRFAMACVTIFIMDGFINYTWSSNNMNYMTKMFQKDNVESGNMYAIQYLTIFVFGIPGGLFMDYVGYRKSLVIGLLLATLGRLILGVTTDYTVAVFALNTFVSMSGGLISVSAHIMCSSIESLLLRILVFILLYFANNLGAFLAYYTGPLILGDYTHEVIRSFQRLFLITASVAFSALLVSVFGTQDYKHVVVEHDISATHWEFWRRLAGDSKLHKAVMLSSVFIAVRMMFADMDTILPIYMANVYGNTASYNRTMIINPVGIILLTLTSLVFPLPFESINQIIVGTTLAALSPLPMILWRHDVGGYAPSIFQVMFTIAEFLWAPLLSQLLVSIPPEGRKGLYTSIVAIPTVIGNMVAGLLGGRLLNAFCKLPVTELYDFWTATSCPNIWIVVSGIAMITPTILFFTRHNFRQKIVVASLPNDDF